MDVINQYTKICIGKDSLEELKKIKNSTILIVSDEFLVKNSIIDKLIENIDKSNKFKVFDKVQPDPSLKIIGEAIKSMLELKATHIIGFGGGSAIDTAKGVIYFLKGSNYLKNDVDFIAIPTTSGTGSEVTSVTVIRDEEKNVKHLLASDDILPDIAILDADFTKSLPRQVVANTGIDVLTHIIEAYVASGANDYSDALAEKSGELIVKYIYESFENKDNFLAKEKMLIASNLAGIAFNIAGLGANHSIAHQIGVIFHIPHGLANAILLKEVIDANAKDEKVKVKYAQFSRKIGLSKKDDTDDVAIEILKKYIDVIMDLMDMPKKISKYGISRQDWEKNKEYLANNALEDNTLKTNPTIISKKDIIAILDKIY